MSDRDEHLRNIASEIFPNCPLDYDDTEIVLRHLHFLNEWRRRGAAALVSTTENGEAGNGGGKDEGGPGRSSPYRTEDDPLGSKSCNISRLRPRFSPS